MQFRTVKGIGKIGTEFSNGVTDGAIISRDLVRQMIDEIARRSFLYFKSTGDHSFYYREKQMNSVICPAIAELSEGSFLMEQPSKRKPSGEKEYSGYVDYWLYFRSYSFLLEMKHAYYPHNWKGKLRKSTTKRLEVAHTQLDMVKKKECRNLCMGNGLIKIAFETIVFYESSKLDDKRNDWQERDYMKLFSNLISNKELSGLINFQALWVLNKNLVEPYDFKRSFEVYPAVAFVGNISEDQVKDV